MLFLTCGLYGQNFDNIGIDDNPNLNEDETKLLNSLLDEKRDDFDFKDKKVAFLTGSSGRTIMAKSDYFKNSVIPWIDDGSRPQISMIKLTKEEKEKSGGYDVLVLSWVKALTRRGQRKIIEELGQENK
jgi:hypothetical protein